MNDEEEWTPEYFERRRERLAVLMNMAHSGLRVTRAPDARFLAGVWVGIADREREQRQDDIEWARDLAILNLTYRYALDGICNVDAD